MVISQVFNKHRDDIKSESKIVGTMVEDQITQPTLVFESMHISVRLVTVEVSRNLSHQSLLSTP